MSLNNISIKFELIFRFAAKYGNPYLQQQQQQQQYYYPPPVPVVPHQQQYATLSGRPVQRGGPAAAAAAAAATGLASGAGAATYSPAGAHKVKTQVREIEFLKALPFLIMAFTVNPGELLWHHGWQRIPGEKRCQRSKRRRGTAAERKLLAAVTVHTVRIDTVCNAIFFTYFVVFSPAPLTDQRPRRPRTQQQPLTSKTMR